MKMILGPLTSAVLIMGLAMVVPAHATEAKLTAGSDAANFDNLGWSVSISGDYAVVGAKGDDDPGPPMRSDVGSAYIFYRSNDTWSKQAKLVPSDLEAMAWFGYSVSISGDYAVVGAEKDHIDGAESGSAYVYHRSGTAWSQEDKLTAGSDGAAFDHFGVSVSISGDYAIVGAFEDDDPEVGISSGSAYMFHRSGATWTKQAKLTASDAEGGDKFGFSVSISGDYAIVSAYGDDDPSDSGAIYVFHRSGTTWIEEAKIKVSDDDTQGDKLGWSVSIAGDYLIGGAVGDDDPSGSGSAYVFHRSGTTWTQQAKLTASDAASGDQFGNSVSIGGDYAVVGADFDNNQTGAAYVFGRAGTTWTQTEKLTASDAAATDYYGESVSISEELAIVGSWGDDDDGALSGSAYVYQVFDPSSDVGEEQPLSSALQLWTPNPFNPVTGIRYNLTEPQRVSLHIYDASGRLVRVLRQEVLEGAGHHEVAWDGTDANGQAVTSGTYMYRLIAGPNMETKRMVLIK